MKHDGATHGTFRDVIDRLPYVTDLGFDVLYFPPIHPIGETNRKGRNNTLTPEPHDVGVPYAIGSAEGGHMAVHPELGTLKDFDALVKAANGAGLEIALDIALNASPDHPWIAEHPDWFEWRPDGTIRYAENPPKKYEDIVNFSFYSPGTDEPVVALWEAMRDMFLFWAKHGVTIFRVDNPHTKPLPFWQWLIEAVHAEHPGAIFLAEAFTKPKTMRRLAKIGFNQSYSYFTWRNEKWELVEYMEQLTGRRPDEGGLGGADMPVNYRPNFFVNTPDINPHFLQEGGRPAHRIRAALAATLATNWGVYNGFEVCDARGLPKPDGSGTKEEYLDSEKYQLRAWDMDAEGNIKDDIRLLNRLRRAHPALQQFANLAFFKAHNDNVIHYGKWTTDRSSFVLVSVNLDPHDAQDAAIEVPLWEFGLPQRRDDRGDGSGHRRGLHLDGHPPARPPDAPRPPLRDLGASRARKGARAPRNHRRRRAGPRGRSTADERGRRPGLSASVAREQKVQSAANTVVLVSQIRKRSVREKRAANGCNGVEPHEIWLAVNVEDGLEPIDRRRRILYGNECGAHARSRIDGVRLKIEEERSVRQTVDVELTHSSKAAGSIPGTRRFCHRSNGSGVLAFNRRRSSNAAALSSFQARERAARSCELRRLSTACSTARRMIESTGSPNS